MITRDTDEEAMEGHMRTDSIRFREQCAQREIVLSREMSEYFAHVSSHATSQVLGAVQYDMGQLAQEQLQRTTMMTQAIEAIAAEANTEFQRMHNDSDSDHIGVAPHASTQDGDERMNFLLPHL